MVIIIDEKAQLWSAIAHEHTIMVTQSMQTILAFCKANKLSLIEAAEWILNVTIHNGPCESESIRQSGRDGRTHSEATRRRR